MRNPQKADLQDAKVPAKVVLSGLWVSMLFVFAYVDIFGFFRADVINGVLTGDVAGTSIVIDQTFLTLATAYILAPSLMIVASLLLHAKVNRVINIIVSLIYLVSIVVTVLGESWTYYVLGSIVEILLLLAIMNSAWNWEKRADTSLPQPATLPSTKSSADRPVTPSI
ncbi:MAG: DUF6326 family protein [Nakamurella sp.]